MQSKYTRAHALGKNIEAASRSPSILTEVRRWRGGGGRKNRQVQERKFWKYLMGRALEGGGREGGGTSVLLYTGKMASRTHADRPSIRW